MLLPVSVMCSFLLLSSGIPFHKYFTISLSIFPIEAVWDAASFCLL